MSIQPVIGLMGTGNMGQALLSGILKSGLIKRTQLIACEKNPALRSRVSRDFRIRVFKDPVEVARRSTILFICVKPQDSLGLFMTIRPALNPRAWVVSIMAAVQIKTIETCLGTNQIIRAMPNLGCMVGKGTIGIFNEYAPTSVIRLVIKIFQTTGKIVSLKKEKDLNRFTAVGGSGPGLMAHFMEIMAEEASQIMSTSEAHDLVREMVLGTCMYLAKTKISFSELRERVSSRGGTTLAGLKAMKQARVRSALTSGIRAAEKRAQELGKMMGRLIKEGD